MASRSTTDRYRIERTSKQVGLLIVTYERGDTAFPARREEWRLRVLYPGAYYMQYSKQIVKIKHGSWRVPQGNGRSRVKRVRVSIDSCVRHNLGVSFGVHYSLC